LASYTGDVTATDNCSDFADMTVTQTPAAGTTISGAVNAITLKVEDENGNFAEVSFNVAVVDNTNPVFTSTHNDLSVDANASCEASLADYTGDVTATDNCSDFADMTVTQTPAAGTTISGATNAVTLKVEDENGNFAEVSFNVAVVDNTDPETPVLSDLSGECSVTATAPTTEDACTGTITGTTSDPTEYTEQGTYTITWNFDDGNGNNIDVEQTVIVEDITNPTISCVGNQTVEADNTHTYIVDGSEFDPIEAFDNCGIASIENDFNNASTLENAQLPEGTTTIVWTVTDNAGNTETCSFDVVVNVFVGVEDFQQSEISIYPNPTQGIVNFDFKNIDVQKITILDITGKTIFEEKVTNQLENLDFSDYSNGVYLIHLMTDKDMFITKIIKE
jgi:hypothetical protein